MILTLTNRPAVLLILIFTLLGCTINIKPNVDVNVIDATDSLEKQILGEFKIIEEDRLFIEEPSSKVESDNTKKDSDFYAAMKERIYFADIIDGFKIKGYIGENIQGRLEMVDNDALNEDSQLKQEVTETVQRDNRAREIIVNYIAEKNEEAENISFYWETFHKISVKRSPDGTLFEEEGTWKRK